MRNKGFSLIELSLAIVIIALLVASISQVSGLIKQAEINGLIIEAEKMRVQYQTFVNEFNALPGDFDRASLFFSNCAQTPLNCNGDGDRNIVWAGNTNDESYKAMLHMNRAGLINNNVPQLLDSHIGISEGVGVDGRRKGTALFYGGFLTPNTVRVAGGIPPLFVSDVAIYTGYFGVFNHTDGAYTGTEAYNIDKKIDDGRVVGSNYKGYNTGKFRAGHDNTATIDCLTGLSGPSYNVGVDVSECFIGFSVN